MSPMASLDKVADTGFLCLKRDRIGGLCDHSDVTFLAARTQARYGRYRAVSHDDSNALMPCKALGIAKCWGVGQGEVLV